MTKRVVKNRLLFLLTEKARKEGKLISQAQLARDLGMSRPTIHDWLNNKLTKVDFSTVVRICDYFGCEVGDLLYLVEIEAIDDETE